MQLIQLHWELLKLDQSGIIAELVVFADRVSDYLFLGLIS